MTMEADIWTNAVASFEDKREHEPRNAGGPQKLERARKQILA